MVFSFVIVCSEWFFLFFLCFFFFFLPFLVFIEFVTILLLLDVLFFGPKVCGILAAWPRDRTHNPCTGRWSLNHWATGEVPSMILNETKLCLSLGMILFWRAEAPLLTQQDFSLGPRAAPLFQEITKQPLPKWDLEMRSLCTWGPWAGRGWRITAGRQLSTCKSLPH